MKNTPFNFVLVGAALLISACASSPISTNLLEQVRVDYVQAQANPKIAAYAALEMQSATDALAKANAASKERESLETVDKLAYLAKQKIALATEVASKKSAEADSTSATTARDQVRLDQRTQQADQARMKAEEAERTAQSARDAEQDAREAAARATQQKNVAQANESEAQRLAAQANAKNAQLEAQLAELAAKKTERGLVITLGDVLFGSDLSRLNAQGIGTTQKLATVLQQNPLRRVLIEGFTDSTGSSTYNQQLSERRANAVRAALLEQGVAAERIAMQGYGESYPVAANETADNRQLNRRVEIVLSDDTGRTIGR